MKGAPRLRRLSEEEIELWLTVASSVTRRAGAALPARSVVPPAPPQPGPVVPPIHLPAPPAPPKPTLPPLAPLERKLKQKLSRGQMTADAAIDLHGFRQDEALPRCSDSSIAPTGMVPRWCWW